jgi:hypothetical protein
MARDINLGPTGGPFITLQENSGDLDITGATDVDINGANLTNANVGGFDSVEVFEADGTFDASSVDTVFVECVGGGGGGGATVDNGIDTLQLGAGGGGGGYAAGYYDVSAESSINVTVGVGGSEASAGGDSSFGAFATGNGGGGGTSADDNNLCAGGSGGGGSGDIVVAGRDGEDGLATDQQQPSELYVVNSCSGGHSQMGFGAVSERVDDSFSSFQEGRAGEKYGGGGSGGTSTNAATNQAGGSGAQGIVIVYYKA